MRGADSSDFVQSKLVAIGHNLFTKIRCRHSSHISTQQNRTAPTANRSEALAGDATFKSCSFKLKK